MNGLLHVVKVRDGEVDEEQTRSGIIHNIAGRDGWNGPPIHSDH
jgi:hypothetical protein